MAFIEKACITFSSVLMLCFQKREDALSTVTSLFLAFRAYTTLDRETIILWHGDQF